MDTKKSSNMGTFLAILGILVPLIGAAITGGISVYNTKKANELSLQNTKELTDTYETPQAKMKNYMLAGLNPNLIYGQAGSGNVSQFQASAAQAPDLSGLGANMLSGIESLAGAKQKGAAARLASSQAANQDIRNLTQLSRDVAELQGQINSNQLSLAQANDIFSAIALRSKQAGLIDAQTYHEWVKTGLTAAKISNVNASTTNIETDTLTKKKSWEVMDADIKLKKAQTILHNREASNAEVTWHLLNQTYEHNAVMQIPEHQKAQIESFLNDHRLENIDKIKSSLEAEWQKAEAELAKVTSDAQYRQWQADHAWLPVIMESIGISVGATAGAFGAAYFGKKGASAATVPPVTGIGFK